MEDNIKLLGEAFIVMIIGIGVVFSFLLILVFLVSISGIIIKLFKLEKEEKTQEIFKSKQDDTQIIAAIFSAIKYNK